VRSRAILRPVVALVSLLVIAGLSAAAAFARDWEVMQVCGASRCVSYHNNAATRVLSGWSKPYGPESAPATAPYYAIRIGYPTAASLGITKMLYVPARHEVRIWQSRTQYSPKPVAAYWRTVPGYAQKTMNRAFVHIDPHPATIAWPAPG
jgi:hypothetical protein